MACVYLITNKLAKVFRLSPARVSSIVRRLCTRNGEMIDSAGRHLILDGYVKDSSVFTAEKLTLLFQNLASALEMKILQGPTFVEVALDAAKLKSDVFEDSGGITGSCIISTSHMALHAWPISNFLSLDVFSCKDFDVSRAMGIIQEHMGLTSSINVMNLDRSKPQAPKE